jgi:hypothetical protein
VNDLSHGFWLVTNPTFDESRFLQEGGAVSSMMDQGKRPSPDDDGLDQCDSLRDAACPMQNVDAASSRQQHQRTLSVHSTSNHKLKTATNSTFLDPSISCDKSLSMAHQSLSQDEYSGRSLVAQQDKLPLLDATHQPSRSFCQSSMLETFHRKPGNPLFMSDAAMIPFARAGTTTWGGTYQETDVEDGFVEGFHLQKSHSWDHSMILAQDDESGFRFRPHRLS